VNPVSNIQNSATLYISKVFIFVAKKFSICRKSHKMGNTKIQDSQYARNLIEATLDPLITIDVDGIIMDVNEAMVKATDTDREKLIGTRFSTYFLEERKAQAIYREVFANEFVLNCPMTIMMV